MSLKTQISARLSAVLTSVLDLVTSTAPLTVSASMDWASGTGANQADKVFSDERTLSASASENLDLAGSLTDAFGVAITFAKVKAIAIFAAAGNTNDVVVGGAASNGFVGPFADATDAIKVKPGGFVIMAAPQAAGLGTVTGGTGDILKVANSGGTTGVTYQTVIIGTSA